MIVISNTSPLINFAIVGHLDLLPQLYGQVIIPQAVYDEIVIIGGGQPGAVEVKAADWIRVHSVTNQAIVTSLEAELDRGEAEAIALTIELDADLLLIDEQRGRRAASRFGLEITGVLGILIKAKQQGLVPELQPVLDKLIEKASFWVAQSLYEQVLQTVGE